MIFNKLTGILFLLALLLFSNSAVAQTCAGSLGDPVINIDFGRGPSVRGQDIGNNTNYIYEPIVGPNDGAYTIAKTTAGMNGGWYNISNHTPADPNGYMMVVNAADNPGIFYETTAQVLLCPNTTYEFAAWIINILTYSGIKPNLTFSILTPENEVIKSFNTGDIEDQNPVWKQYGFLFRTTTSSIVKLRIENNGPGGNGNDIALDDITFRPCGPAISASISSTGNSTLRNICEGTNASFNFSATVQGSPTLKHQWQISENNGVWTDVPGKTTTAMAVNFTNATKGIYQYRLTSAEPGNFNSTECRIASPVLTLNVNPIPQLIEPPEQKVCLGQSITVDINYSNGTYAWTGPNGFTSSEKSLKIINAAYSMTGIYRLKVTSAAGCTATTQTSIEVVPPTKAAVKNSELKICPNSSIRLEASGGAIFKWFPEEGLSDANVANPVASPVKTTLYTVIVSNGVCQETLQVNVIVNINPEAATGSDKKIFEGEYITLEGNAKGDDISYYWSPATGLDDPYKLNPVASPREDVLYTFNVVSNLGCGIATSQTFIRVYQDVSVPNSFTPNGDSINDTWQLNKINTYKTPRIRIMNRYGMLIFESTGYEKPWDGKYKNGDAAVGVYYYIITLEDNLKPITGSLTLIR